MKETEDRKEGKKERKQAQERDRSKYKKSVHRKHEQQRALIQEERLADQELLRGRVVSIFSEQILVYYEGKTITCTLRGILKKESRLTHNLVVVGDFVLFALLSSLEGTIWHIEKRQSLLAKAGKRKEKEQFIAANLDQVLIIASVEEPPFDLAYIDRLMIATLRGMMQPILVINKIDLGISSKVEESIAVYQSLKIPVIQTSSTTGEGIEELKKMMEGTSSVFAGLSGVGKSSLINQIVGSDLLTQEVSEKSKRGRHTTTRSSLIHLSFGGFCIDTPGIQHFGLLELSKDDLDHYFYDIFELSGGCKFFNCTHSHEPYCAVKRAVEEGGLSPLRLASYQDLVKTVVK